jgi:dephospho-CoA kinase
MNHQKEKIVFGLSGIIASGKDTVADYLVEKYGAEKLSFSAPLRDILNKLFLPVNRAHMSDLAELLMRRFGQDLLSKVISKSVELSDKKMFVLPNIRREADYSALLKFNFVLVGVKTDKEKCYNRLIQRNQNEDDKIKTWQEFQSDLQRSTEVDIPHLVSKAAFQLDNNGSFDDLYRQVDNIMQQLGLSA